MFRKPRPTDDTTLQDVINDVLNQSAGIKKDTDEFATLMIHLKDLYALQEKHSSRNRVSADKMVDVGGNLIGIFAILTWEQTHVITSKALGFIRK